MQLQDTDNPLYIDTRHNDKIRYNNNFIGSKVSLRGNN